MIYIHHYSIKQSTFTLLKFSVFCLFLSLSTPTPTTSKSDLCIVSIILLFFQNVIQFESYVMQSLQFRFFHSVICVMFPMSFHGLIAHFFLALNSIPSSGCTTVCLSSLLKNILVAPSFENFEQSWYKRLCAGFCMYVFRQILWGNIKECDHSIIF